MAQRDRSQGFAFVYADIASLLAQRAEISTDAHAPVIPPQQSKVVRITSKPKVQTKTQKGSESASQRVLENAPKPGTQSAEKKEIKSSLDRLQVLHQRLHAMLEELNEITGKRRR